MSNWSVRRWERWRAFWAGWCFGGAAWDVIGYNWFNLNFYLAFICLLVTIFCGVSIWRISTRRIHTLRARQKEMESF